jgi:ParB family chromosome partitioning protein
VRQFAPKADQKQLEDFVLKACEHYRKYLNRLQERDR